MTTHEHVLSNGYTFLAVTAGQYGTWARATDPMTAIRNAAEEIGLFTVTPKSITPTKKGDANKTHENCEEWIEKVLSDIRESLAA